MTVRFNTVDVDGIKLFYREAGDASRPTVLLLHGFPSASHMFRDLIPELSQHYHVVAPDLPGFGMTEQPSRDQFGYTFENITNVVDRFTEVLGLDKFAIYVFDYGAPVGFRLAVKHPERITAIVTQNGNTYVEGVSDAFAPVMAYWNEPSQANRDALRGFLRPRQPSSSTRTGSMIRQRSLQTAVILTISICRVPATTKSSSTCSSTTRPTSRSTTPSRPTCARISRRCWRSGARTIRSSFRRVPKHSSAMYRLRTFASSTADTSRSKPMPPRSALRCANSSPSMSDEPPVRAHHSAPGPSNQEP